MARRAKTAEPAVRIVAIAASAGGLNALAAVLSELPPHFPAPIVIVQHLDRTHPSLLSEILGRRTALIVQEAEAGDEIEPGHAYVSPPDKHLLVAEHGKLELTHTELVHFVRPSADLLFESVAACFGARAIGVILTGSGSDGAMGASAIDSRGGILIAQNEATSQHFGMPGAAIAQAKVDFVLPLAAIAPKLIELTGVTANER